MTKEAMIKVLRYKAEHIKTKIRPEFFAEVADMLEQQPCEDTISRADAIRVASGYCHPSNIAIELAKLPPVTPKPKAECSCDQIKWERDMAIAQLNELGYGLGEKPRTGHWIEEKISGHEVNVCSHCQHIQHKEPTWHYCPLCGADMREVEE